MKLDLSLCPGFHPFATDGADTQADGGKLLRMARHTFQLDIK
jgi:hypothetical protein